MTDASNPMVRALAVAALVLLPTIASGASVPGQGTWETTLQARDLDGNGTADAFFDTSLNVTWLADANAFGGGNWYSAVAWTTDLVVGGHSGWRLPTMVDTFTAPVAGPDGCNMSFAGGTDCGFNVQTKSGDTVYSEMAHLFYVTLGNKAYCPPGDLICSAAPQPGWGLTNTGNYQNMQASDYWLGLELVSEMTRAWHFGLQQGFQDSGGYSKLSGNYAMAVHDGDLTSAVPEPETLFLMLGGLGVLMVAGRRRQRH